MASFWTSKRLRHVAVVFIVALLVACGSEEPNEPAAMAPSPGDAQSREKRVFWGDLHVHSRFSFDAYSFGNTNLSPDDAYRFARGEAIEGHTGEVAQLQRPLDFLMVSDHAEYLGILAGLEDSAKELDANVLARRWKSYSDEGDVASIVAEYVKSIDESKPLDDYLPKPFLDSIWAAIIEAAERHNEPGRFTAFIGYEWTSMVTGRNLHRNVVFRDGPERTSRILPFSALDGPDPEALWSFLSAYENETGGRVIAIPHNGNLSNGLMFSPNDFSGDPIDRAYASARARWEPLYEMTQVKGDAEAHPMLSPDDDLADFENWDETDISMVPKPAGELANFYRGEYARPALRRGLALERKVGVNPFKFGMIGSTDSHTAFATADDGNYFGKFPDSEPSAQRLDSRMGGVLWDNRQLSASGYTGIWALENTREALFDALERREVYASTGPRVVLRFFGSWGFSDDDADNPELALIGYRRGVPMGADLPAREGSAAPTFLLSVAKDPVGANLARLQVVKGWLTSEGTTAEAIFDVHSTPLDRGHTVDVTTATYTNTIGFESHAAVWTDPTFDPDLPSFYYVRVVEIPTPRWTTYDAVRYGLELPTDVPAVIQERAYSSPIWYTPTVASE